ncbi:uncharacterized protein TNCV_4894581 [Trichonephila clavipes]|nr:uncharacterized protein TNCV_4894581 [Trichonephila clavipes]
MSFVFGEEAQELQMLHKIPSIFDGDLISFLDEFERELAPMYLTMPRLNSCNGFGTTLVGPVSTSHHYRIWKSGSVAGSSHVLRVRVSLHHLFEPNFGARVPRSFGKTVIVFTSHLDVTWDKGVDLKLFRVGRSSSRQVWKAYPPQNTEAYPLDLTHCTQLADVYVNWLMWLDDWEMHRDENLPWRVVCPQPWKRALETHVERSHQKALAQGMPSDVTLLEHL